MNLTAVRIPLVTSNLPVFSQTVTLSKQESGCKLFTMQVRKKRQMYQEEQAIRQALPDLKAKKMLMLLYYYM